MTRNPSLYKENTSNLVSKIFIIRELYFINLDKLSITLGNMNIDKINIFSIHNELESKSINTVISNKGSKTTYIEMNTNTFITFLNEGDNFLEYNKDSLYIFRKGNFLNIKNIFTTINGCNVNLGRGSSQKSHGLSPLDFRLSSYLMAMFNFNYKLISYLNTFNVMSKDRYLSWKDRSLYKHKNYNFTSSNSEKKL